MTVLAPHSESPCAASSAAVETRSSRFSGRELAAIPMGWQMRPLLSAVSLPSGQVDPKREPYSSMILVAPDHVESGTGRLLARVTAAQQRAISGKFLFTSGNIVYSKIRPYLRKAILADFQGLCSADMYPLTPASDVSPAFILTVLLGDRFSSFAECVSVRSGIPKINREELAQYSLALPPLPEQRAIATALSDVVGLIETLGKLIDEKRAMKQAIMRVLLRGETRLPGFIGRWEATIAGEVGRFRGGSGFPRRYQGGRGGDYPFFKVSDMNHPANRVLMVHSNNWVSNEVRSLLGVTVFPANSIVFAKVGAAVFLERKRLLARPSCIDNNMTAFVVDATRADYLFLFWWLLNTRLGDLVATTALPSINGQQLRKIPLALPPLPEQRAIAAVLSDMDAEIAALERRRDKTRAIKQGMMQALLTGRVRLPPIAAAPGAGP
jgi:type I restriction enzyme S subunit